MIRRSELSLELYEEMKRRGYPGEFCQAVTENLNTDFTAKRMLGYLSYYDRLPMEEVADEMLSILEDRQRIMNKIELEKTNEKWNEFLREDFEEED